MSFTHPWLLAAILPAAGLLWWFSRRSLRLLAPARRLALLGVRAGLVAVALVAVAAPGGQRAADWQAVIFVLDHSQSQGADGMKASCDAANRLAAGLDGRTCVGAVSAGRSTVVRSPPGLDRQPFEPDEGLLDRDGGQTDLASAVRLASGLFPPGTARRLVLVGDGQETRGDLEAAAREAALKDIVIDALPVAGPRRPDVRVVRLASDKSRSHEGATIELRADVESSLDGEGLVRLFENGIEVESRAVKLAVGQQLGAVFRRTPEERNLYTYRVRAEGFPRDSVPDNDEAMALVDVRGQPLLLYIEGEPDEARFLVDAMAREGIRLQTRGPDGLPQTLQELAGYDGLVLSDVPARKLSERSMSLIHDYVEKLGGGFVMIGGRNSFGVGGYYRTPIEDVLPVKMKAPDKEERFATALCLVLDRSGSMEGEKVEICKSAAIATVELLKGDDYVGVVAFDSEARWIVPITKASSKGTVSAQIATINAGGGTNLYPAMLLAREALASVQTKVKHAIVLSDGQTEGGGYEALAGQMRSEGMTISTVAIGQGAHTALMQAIASHGGGQFYETLDPVNLPRIFTQDAMTHLGRLIREEAFAPKQVERHPMLKGCPVGDSPTLLGYVKTMRKATAQVPLVTDLGEPLLAHWQFGLGKVTAFTSDCKSRWAALWITGWQGYGQFWAQVLRETARHPQSQTMDLRLEEKPPEVRVVVDLLEDPAHFDNDAQVTADIYFVSAGALRAGMQALDQVRLEQSGPGRYEGRFRPDEPGVYLVRARSGAQMVSAGLVHNPSGEAATGQVNRTLLEKVCRITGGTLLESPETGLEPVSAGHARFVELAPWLLKLLLLLFLADVTIRRWENVQGMWEAVRSWRSAA